MGSSRRFCSSSSDECRAGQSGSPCRRGSALVGGPCLTASKLSRSHEDGPGRSLPDFVYVRYGLPGGDPADQVVLVPAREDEQFLRVVVQPGFDDGVVPVPRVVADERRVGLLRIFVQVVQDEYVDRPAGQRSVAADAQQPASGADQFELLGRAQSAAILGGRAFEAGSGENAPVSGCVHEPLNLPVEP